jgi:hypothetical protein
VPVALPEGVSLGSGTVASSPQANMIDTSAHPTRSRLMRSFSRVLGSRDRNGSKTRARSRGLFLLAVLCT